MCIRIGALAAASPIFFIAASAIAFSTSLNAAEQRATAVVLLRQEAGSGQKAPPPQPPPPPPSGNAPGSKGGNPSAKEARWEGTVIRSKKDNSTLTVRQRSSNQERIVQYDSSTKWVSQEHSSKKVNDIDASQIKDSDRVIVLGEYDDKGVLHARIISKRSD